jgi:hypothetical protein
VRPPRALMKQFEEQKRKRGQLVELSCSIYRVEVVNRAVGRELNAGGRWL